MELKKGWQSYELDRIAQDLVLKHRDSLNQSHKMRETVAYGLERFWGEYLRLQANGETKKAAYWKATWDKFVEVMNQAGLSLPNDEIDPVKTAQIEQMANKLWQLTIPEQRVALAVLTQLCDSLVWWTQRFKPIENSQLSGNKQTPKRNLDKPKPKNRS